MHAKHARRTPGSPASTLRSTDECAGWSKEAKRYARPQNDFFGAGAICWSGNAVPFWPSAFSRHGCGRGPSSPGPLVGLWPVPTRVVSLVRGAVAALAAVATSPMCVAVAAVAVAAVAVVAAVVAAVAAAVAAVVVAMLFPSFATLFATTAAFLGLVGDGQTTVVPSIPAAVSVPTDVAPPRTTVEKYETRCVGTISRRHA